MNQILFGDCRESMQQLIDQGTKVQMCVMGSGTTAAVALTHDRQYLGCELNPSYEELQNTRLKKFEEVL